MRKKLIKTCLTLLVLVLWLNLGLGLYHTRTYITIRDTEYRRNCAELTLSGFSSEDLAQLTQLDSLQVLDLRQASIRTADYDLIRASLPNCEILWQVPFQQTTYPHDITELTLTGLAPEDIPLLAYFPRLTTIHAEDCRDYDALLTLVSQRPDLEVLYTVLIGGQAYPQDTQALTLTDVVLPELADAIPRLPGLTHISLDGTLPEAPVLLALREQYPDIEWYWQIEVFGVTADIYTTELDLSGIPMDSVDQAEAAAAYLPNVQKVLMLDCGISDEEMSQLNKRHDGPLFVWNVVINKYITLRSDVTAFAPVKTRSEVWEGNLEQLKYCTELVALDLGHMNLWNCRGLAELTKLEYLIIADTHIWDISPLANLKNLKYLEMFMTHVSDYTPLLELTQLEDLNISYTAGDPAPIMQMTWLKRLWWGNGCLTKEQQQQLQEALPDTEIVYPRLGSTDDGWRTGPLYFEMRDWLGMPYLE